MNIKDFSGVGFAENLFNKLTPDFSGAIDAAQFNPVNVQGSMGSVNYNPESRMFASQLDPRLLQLQSGLFDSMGQSGNQMGMASDYLSQAMGQLGGQDPQAQLDLMRQRAAPFNEQLQLGTENRLFSQGLLGHSGQYKPGGAMFGVNQALLDQDLNMQLLAQQQSQQAEQHARGGVTQAMNLQNQSQGMQLNTLNQLFGLANLENSLFGNALSGSGLAQNSQNQVSQLMMQDALSVPNLLGSLIGGGMAAFGGR